MIDRPRTATTPLASVGAILVGALFLGGCNGAFVGNIVVLFVSVGIFFGTLNLGRFTRSPASTSTAEQSHRDR
jgi:hypothetical protein